ncbi:hypothetical protein V3C99_013768 [Haemonchus contortus]
MDRRPTDDAAPLRSDLRELRVNTESTEWVGAPSPRRVLTAPNSPSTAFRTDREAIFRSGNATVAETHLIRSTGSQSNSFTEEHWSSEITSFVTAAPPKFIQVIKAYRILSSDTPTLVVEVASDPPAIFEWFCNDKPVQQDRRRFQARHGLNITTLTVHQPEQGVYKCTARNPAGVSTSYGYITVNFEHQYDEWTIVDRSMVTQEGQTTVTVHRSPRFINQVPNLTVQPGSEVVIDVEVDADPPARFTWFVNGREFRESSKGVELFYPSTNRCVVKFAFPVSGEYKVVASNVHGSAMSSGYVEIHRAKPSKQMRPPVSAGEHISRNIMAASHHAGSTATPTAPDGQELLQTHQTVDVYEVNYTQRASSVPRGVRHLESHVEMPISPRRRVSLEQHRAEIGKKLPDRLPRSLYKTRSEGARYLPHAPNFITTLPAEITVNPNEKLVLSVDVTALPMAEFRWDVNGFEVKSSKNITLLNEQNRSTLVVQPPIKQGRYNVVAFNSEGRESQQTRVLVETHVVEEAQAAETKAGPDIQESSVTVTSTNEPDWDIVDSVASTASTTSFLTVTRRELPAKDEVPKTKTVIKEEKTIVLNGVASQVPVVVQEMKAEETTTSETFVKAKSAPRVEEKLPKKPVLLSEPWQDLHLKVGEKLILEMKVDSIPPATFRWYVNNFEAKNGQFVSITQPHDNVSIAIFSKPTPGQYKVVAANPLGEVTSITRITTERTVEEFKESTTVTTSLPRPPLFTLKKKPIITVREDLPKPPHIIEKLPPLLRINSTSPISLQVRADAVPEATFMWLLNNFELRKTQNIEISRLASNVSQLHLQKVQPGRYDVVASNRLGQDSSSCKVIVQYEQEEPAASPKPPPIFTQSLSKETVVLLGEETRIEVIASGTPPFSFKWFINGSEISSSKDIEIVVDGNRSTLRVQKSLGNKAVLIVEVTDRNGTARSETIIKEISKTTTMVEAIPPRVTTTVKEVTETRKEVVEKQPSPAANKAPMFTQKLDNIELMEGDTLRCHVKVSDESDSCTFEWYANDMQITSGEQVFIESGLRESRLSIENMGEMSGVKLTAIARNPHGTSVSAAELNVVRGPDESFEMVPPDVPEESAPKIIEPLHSASFIDGQPMVLRCRIKAVPSAVIVWSKDDLNVDEWVINKDIVTQIHPDGICELMNPEVYPEDSGLYKCTATNPHGTAETAAYINIQGPLDYSKGTEDGSASAESAMMPEEPPKFVEKLTAETDGAYDLNYIRLICRVKSIIRAKITWWKNDVQLIPGEKYELHEFSDGALILTIHSPTPSDNGIYTCKAESENGLSSTSCEVIVPTRTITTEKVSETQTETETITETVDHSSFEITETSKEDYIATTEITKHEEEYKLLVKVAENVASALVANVFVDAVREAVKKIMEEESEEEEIEVTNAPRFETCIERYVVKENDTVTISTVVTGEPTPFIEWYFKDQKLNVTEQISMGYENRVATLILKNVTFAQEGTYYCHATNTHGTTVLPSEVKVVPEKASDTVRISLAKYDKREGSEQLITNVHAYHTDELHEQSIGVHVPEKESVSGRCSAIPSRSEKIAEVPPEQSTVEKQLLEQISSQQKSEVVQPPEQPAVGVQPTEQPPAAIEPIGPSPVPPPRKHTPKEKEVVVPIIRETSRTEDDVRESEERKVRSVAVKFAEKLAENVMSQAQTDLRSSVQTDESTIRITQVSGAKVLEKGAQDTEAVEKVPTTISAFPLQTSTIISKSAASMEETSQAGMTTIDVRKPDTQFDHVVTVVEPEVVQLGLRLPSPSVPSMKFIDLETILQRPGTSSSANTLISSPHRGAANAEHRIVLLEGMSQKFHNAMTLSLKKVKRLATESAEPSSFVQVEIIKPNETSEEVLTIVNAEKLIPDLLRVAAAASKLKMENVTVSLVKQGDAAHQELVIEYESHVEDAAHFNLSQLLYENPQREVSSRQETWSRRSRFSDVDENVVAVFMEVDANCPNQSVEIVASVSTPLESKVDRSPSSPSPERLEVSESLTESSSAVGQQIPKFVRTLQDCQTVIGRSAQFKCIVTGMPPPEVAWYVDGDVIHSCREYEIVYEDGVCILRINEAMAEDEGEYSCEAKNSAGKAVTKCYLKVLKDEPTQPLRRFIQHVPSVVELVDDDAADSFDSFEWEENKANRLFPSDTDSFKGSSITYHSEFDLSRIVNYNEDMEETNAFHRYFDTAIVGIIIMEREQRERIYASFLSRPAASAHVDLVIPKPASYSSAAHLFALPSVHITHSDILGSLKKTEVEQMTGEQYEEDLRKTEKPREPDLPLKMSYKGQEIAISVNKIEKEEMILNKVGEIEISKKTCVETSLDFDTELDITQSIRRIRDALPDQTGDLDHVTGHRFEENTISHEMSMTVSPETKYEDLSLKKQTYQGPRLPERPRAQSAKPTPRLFGDTGKSVSEGAAKLESTMFDPEFLSKMKEIERIARQVDEELGQLSSSPRRKGSPPEDVKEIEEAIYKISDQLMLARPITEAQAEANEELLRTTLADMILNPTRTAAEELELMKRPIQLLKRKLSDLENSLLEDAEVTDITEHPCVVTETAILTGETPPILRSQTGPRARIPSADYLRVTPLTSSIKDQLSSLEKMITDHMNGETSDSTEETAESEVQPLIKSGNHKKHELHDLFVQINNEINTIKTYCRTQLSKKGTDAVMNVLHKVRTHVASIVNVMSLSKKKHPKIHRKHTASVTREFDLERPVEEHQITAVVMAKSFSMENSDYHKSSTAASTSDDTLRYSTELKSSWKGALRGDGGEDSEPPLIATVESTTEEEAPPAPVAPPRRRRTRSEDAESIDPPTRPPRKMKDIRKRDLSLDDRLTSKRATDTMKPADIVRPPERDNNSPSKTIKSFAGDTIDMLRNLGCVRAQKDDADDLEKSLLEELSQMAVSQSKGEVLSETEWVQSELEQSLKRAAQKAQALSKSDDEHELEPISIYETAADPLTKDETYFMPKPEEMVSLKPEQAVDMNYAGTSLSAAYLKLSEATAALEIPLTNVMTASGDVGIDDGVSSVQLICEESDYTTDTDTSALLKGTVQFFNRYSPKDATPQSVSSLSVSQRNSKIMPELIEKDESIEIDVDIEFHNSETNEKEDVELLYTEVKVMTKSDEKGKSFRSSIYESHDPSLEKESVSEDTDHLVLEEAHLSQMVSSEWTDDTDRMTPSSRTAIKETDILSDDSVITEIDRSILDNTEGTFTFFRAREKKAVIAVVYPDVRLFVSARVAENTFDIEIQQEPECLALVIRVIEDQVNFTSLTVMEFTSQQLSAQRTFDEVDEEASSLEDIDGDSRTGITVSIIARSLHDGIYASLEEIPWGEVEMTLPECETMGKSIEDESKTSLQFNVTVSETNPDERKSIRSQASMELSQNTVSEADNTLSTGSINIPSYVIKLGSTATITCELNNYLPPNSKIDWYKGSSQVVTCPGKLDRISHDLLEVLIINNIEMEDNELYSLKVNDDIFPVAYLIVEAPSTEEFISATILTPPQTQFVMEGQPTVLMCQVSDPSQEIVWLKDRRPLKETARLQLENTGDGWSRVVFSHTRMSDQGTYFAYLGEQSVAITLVVEERIDEKEVTVVASGTESEDEDVQEYLMPPGSTATIASEEPTEETCVPAGAIATINCETLTEQLNIEWKKEGNSLVVSRGKTREIDSRFIAEDSEDGRQHSLTIVSVQPGDAGEYGVVIDGVYTIVTRIVVTESEVFTQFIYEEPEIDVSLQMDSVKDDACVGMTEQVKTRLEKDVQQSDVEAVAGEEGFEIVDADEVEVHRAEEVMRKEAVSQFPEKEFAVVEKDLHVTEKEELKSKKVVELDLKRIDEAALEAAAAVAMEITEKLLADAFTEVDQIEKEEREAPAMPQVLSSSDVTTPTSDTFEKVPEIFIEPMTDEGVSTPEELPEDDLTLADLSAGGFEFVRSLVEESIQKAMAEVSSMEVHALIADKGEKSAEMVEVQRESEQKRITDVEDLTSKTSDQPDAGSLHEKPSEEQILKIDAQVPEKGEEAVYQRGPEELKSKEEEEEVPSERLLDTGSDVTAVFKEVDNLQARDIVSEGAACIASEFVTAQVEDVAVLLQFDREDTHSAVDFSFARPRKCKLTVFLTFDQAIDVVPTEEVHLHVEYSHASQTESSEVILSQIMYEDDEASTIDDTLTSISSSCLYCPPEFVSPLQPKYEIQRNTRALLKVVVTGVPLPQVIWYHNGNVLNSIKNVLNIIYEDGVSFLEIYNCTERWSGVFTCEAKNSAGVTKIESILTVLPEESEGPVRPTEIHLSNIPFQEDVEHIIHDSAHRDFHSAALTLGVDASVLEQRSSSPEVSDYSSASSGAGQAPTFIVTMPPQIYSKVNENIQLKCTFTGQPLPAVTWEKDGNLVDLNRNYNIITEDGVTILRLECTTLEDNAIFSCTVANNFGMQTANCKVIIEDEVLEHKHIGTQVICDRESASGEVDAVMMSPRTTATTFTFPSSEVVERSKEHGETKEDVSIEDVDEQKPVFLLPLEDSVFKGNTSTLKCIIMAAPTALIEWKIDDQVVTKDEEHGIIYEDGIAILKIRNIQRDDLRVSCTATNRNGRAESHCQLTRVHERSLHEEGQSPRFIIPLKNICTCAEEVTLKCIIEAEPIPEVTWFVDENMQTQRQVLLHFYKYIPFFTQPIFLDIH